MEEKQPKVSKLEKIADEDLKTIQDSKLAFDIVALNTELAVAKKNSAYLEHQNVLLRIYLKYGLSESDVINHQDGSIKFSKEEK